MWVIESFGERLHNNDKYSSDEIEAVATSTTLEVPSETNPESMDADIIEKVIRICNSNNFVVDSETELEKVIVLYCKEWCEHFDSSFQNFRKLVTEWPSDEKRKEDLKKFFDNYSRRINSKLLYDELCSSLSGNYCNVDSSSLIEQAIQLQKEQTTFNFTLPNNLEIKDCGADGDCLFRSVAYHTKGKTATGLRQLVAAALKSNRNLIAPFIEADGSNIILTLSNGTTELVTSFDRYCDLMLTPGTWGGEIEISILAQLLRKPIVSVAEGYKSLRYPSGTSVTGEPTYTGKPIFIYYNGHNHYRTMFVNYEAPGAIFNSLTLTGSSASFGLFDSPIRLSNSINSRSATLEMR